MRMIRRRNQPEQTINLISISSIIIIIIIIIEGLKNPKKFQFIVIHMKYKGRNVLEEFC